MLGSQSIWPSREDVSCYIPERSRTLYPITKVIIDCTEIHVQTPTHSYYSLNYTRLTKAILPLKV